jgi:hypothetical protein
MVSVIARFKVLTSVLMIQYSEMLRHVDWLIRVVAQFRRSVCLHLQGLFFGLTSVLMNFKCATTLCHVECLTLEKGALRFFETPPLALCQSTRRNIPGDLNRHYYRCETLSVSLVITFSSCLLPDCFQKCPCCYAVCPLQYTEMAVRARSVSEIRNASCASAVLTEKLWHTSIQQTAQNRL